MTALRGYPTALDTDKTDRLRRVAVAFVAAREHFFTKEGDPDWLGRTYAYRRWVRETYTLASIPNDTLATVQGAVRYHAGNELRQHLDSAALEDLGLRTMSPRERSVEKRERHTETLAMFGAGGQEIITAEDVLTVSRMIESALRRVSVTAVRGLPAKDRRAVREALARVCAAAESIAGAGAVR